MSEIVLRIALPDALPDALTAALVRLCDRLALDAPAPPHGTRRRAVGELLDPQAVERVQALAERGASSREIVRKAGVSKHAALKYMAGVPLAPGAAKKAKGRQPTPRGNAIRAALAAGEARSAIAERLGVSRKSVENIAFRTRHGSARKLAASANANAGAAAPLPAAAASTPAQAVAGGGPAVGVSSPTAPASGLEAGAFLGATVPVTRGRAKEWGRAAGLSGHALDSLGAINARRRKLGKPAFVVVPSNGTLTRPL